MLDFSLCIDLQWRYSCCKICYRMNEVLTVEYHGLVLDRCMHALQFVIVGWGGYQDPVWNLDAYLGPGVI